MKAENYQKVLKEWDKFVGRKIKNKIWQDELTIECFECYVDICEKIEADNNDDFRVAKRDFVEDLLFLMLRQASIYLSVNTKDKIKYTQSAAYSSDWRLDSLIKNFTTLIIPRVEGISSSDRKLIRMVDYLKDYYFIKLNEPEKPLCFKVRYEFEIEGRAHKGIETEASWYYLDQRGNFYSNAPFKEIVECDMSIYKELTPLIKINNEYLSIKEIERRIK